ncbi:hypothetical protein [Kitasatospora sp. NBC_00458]|uniref:hypothetical protein n=1 Tax=Kitasatospora sp. NBC_00458 TaxID=2903568 RepID=UPI002E178721
MTAPRRFLLAVLLCCTVTAGLAACTPIDEDPTVAMASDGDEGAADYWDADEADEAEPWEEDADQEYGAGTDSAPAAPSPADCTALAQQPGHQVVRVVEEIEGRLSARPTRYVCSPDAPDDGSYDPFGEPVAYPLAARVTATLVDLEHGEPAKEVQLPVLMQHLDDCLADRVPEAPYGCYGDTYDIVLDARGRITRITELYHP